MKRSARYLLAVTVLGGALLVVLSLLPHNRLVPRPVLTFAAALAVADAIGVLLPGGLRLAPALPGVLLALALWGLPTTLWAIALAGLAVAVTQDRDPAAAGFNIGRRLLAAGAAALAAGMLAGVARLLVEGLVFLALDTLMVAPALPSVHRGGLRLGLRALAAPGPLLLAVGAAIAAAAASALHGSDVLPVMVSCLAALACCGWAVRLVGHVGRRGIVRRLAAEVVARSRPDLESFVQLCGDAARACGLDGEAIEAVRLAALLHDATRPAAARDLGAKPGPLTAAERAEVQRHPAAAALALIRVPSLAGVACVLENHHERLDGRGYPRGLRGADIPAGAQVFACCEIYAALTASRPYRLQPLAPEAALGHLQREAGRSLDARAVAATRRAASLPPVTPLSVGALLGDLERAGQLAGGPEPRDDNTVLRDLVRGMCRAETREAVLRHLVRAAAILTRGRAAVFDPGSGVMTARAAWGWPEPIEGIDLPRQAGSWLDGQPGAAAGLRPTASLPEGSLRDLLRRDGVSQMALLPLPGDAEVRRLTLLVTGPSGRALRPDELGLAEAACELAGGALNALGKREAAEEARALAERERALLTALGEVVDEPAYVAGEDGRLLVVNAAGRALLTRVGAGGDPVGKPVADALRAAGTPDPLTAAMGGYPPPAGTAVLLGEGREARVHWRATAARTESAALAGAVAVARPADPEDAMRQRERLAAIGQLAAGAAHEIRNPLTAIRGLLEDVGPGRMPEAAAAEIMRDEIGRIEEIASDLLVMARPGGTGGRPCDLVALCNRVATLFSAQAAAAGVRLVVSAEGTPPTPRGDPDRLTQVLVNLVRNALDVSVAGDAVDLFVAPATGGVHVEVRDRGPGIPESQRPRIFDPFFSTKPDGTGLGLAVTQGIVRAHGGRLEVLCPPAGGATMRVWLPAPAAPGGRGATV